MSNIRWYTSISPIPNISFHQIVKPAARENTATHLCNIQPYCFFTQIIYIETYQLMCSQNNTIAVTITTEAYELLHGFHKLLATMSTTIRTFTQC